MADWIETVLAIEEMFQSRGKRRDWESCVSEPHTDFSWMAVLRIVSGGAVRRG